MKISGGRVNRFFMFADLTAVDYQPMSGSRLRYRDHGVRAGPVIESAKMVRSIHPVPRDDCQGGRYSDFGRHPATRNDVNARNSRSASQDDR